LKNNEDIKFNVTYQGLSNYRRPFNENIRTKIYNYIDNIDSFHYVFFIKNYRNVLKDIEEFEKIDKNVEYIFYFEKDDFKFVKELNNTELKELKNIINKIFPNSIFNKRSLFNKKDILYLGPYNLNLYYSRQSIDRENCKDCYPLTSEHDTCQECLTYSNVDKFSLDIKKEYIEAFEKFKKIIKINDGEII